jgi:hypothetical protein
MQNLCIKMSRTFGTVLTSAVYSIGLCSSIHISYAPGGHKLGRRVSKRSDCTIRASAPENLGGSGGAGKFQRAYHDRPGIIGCRRPSRMTALWSHPKTDLERFMKARRGDSLMTPFECDFVCLSEASQKEEPGEFRPIDLYLQMGNRRVILENNSSS